MKEQAEAILGKSGFSVSMLINTLYRQIIKTGGVPYALSLHKISTLDSINTAQFYEMMEKGLNDAKVENGFSLDESFQKIRKSI